MGIVLLLCDIGFICIFCLCTGLFLSGATSEKFILNMYKKGYALDQIADVAETSVEVVEAIIKKKEPVMA